jgi:hypothetical protein
MKRTFCLLLPIIPLCSEIAAGAEIPLAVDWDGDGVSELGFFENGTFRLDTNGELRY